MNVIYIFLTQVRESEKNASLLLQTGACLSHQEETKLLKEELSP